MANEGPRQPTLANAGPPHLVQTHPAQHRSPTANAGQHRPTRATNTPFPPTTTPETHVRAIVRAFLFILYFFFTRNACTSNRTRVSSHISLIYPPKRTYEHSYVRFFLYSITKRTYEQSYVRFVFHFNFLSPATRVRAIVHASLLFFVIF
jgi:hypothetical protein